MSPAHLKLLLQILAFTLALSVAFGAAAKISTLERSWRSLARHRGLAVLTVFLFALLSRAALLPILPMPQPAIHDEFSHLLTADTFARGRLTNPTHPLWRHFETFNVIFRPTYASMYPPGQGAVLALGRALSASPWTGVWLSAAAMSAAICWMLQAWFPPQWALLGGVLSVLRFGLVDYWINSYWGGALPALGGALVLGALPRIVRRQRRFDAAWMGLGLALLANTRAYEGCLLAVPVAIALSIGLARKSHRGQRSVIRVLLTLGLFIAATAAQLGYYSWRVTGDPFVPPYRVFLDTYYPGPIFLWQSPTPLPPYAHPFMRRHFEANLVSHYEIKRSSVIGYLKAQYSRRTYFAFYLDLATALPLVMLPWILRDRRVRLLGAVAAVVIGGILVEAVPFLPHYAAPITSILVASVLQGLRHLRVLGRGKARPMGRLIVRTLVISCALSTAIEAVGGSMGLPTVDSWLRLLDRPRIQEQLERSPGPQLALVRYEPSHDTHDEWVYNEAEIDAAKVVWARDMGARDNRELLDYFHGRTIWLVEPDVTPPRLSLYRSRGDSSDSVPPWR